MSSVSVPAADLLGAAYDPKVRTRLAGAEELQGLTGFQSFQRPRSKGALPSLGFYFAGFLDKAGYWKAGKKANLKTGVPSMIILIAPSHRQQAWG